MLEKNLLRVKQSLNFIPTDIFASRRKLMTPAEGSKQFKTNASIFKTLPIGEAIEVPFVNGVYAGKTLRDILTFDPSYLVYMIRATERKGSYPGIEVLFPEFYEKALSHKIEHLEKDLELYKKELSLFKSTGQASYVPV